MPNWCNNYAVIDHEDPSEIRRLAEAFKEGKFCDAVIPVPEDLQITAGFLGDEEAQKELERKTAENVEKYGAGNWYDFCTSRWGTKWDVGGDGYEADVEEGPNGASMSITFDSAWSPPVGVYERLTEKGFTVDAMYYEPGMGYCGRYTSESGDDYYELGEMTADEVADQIDPEIDECFGISETIAEYEEERRMEEELYAFVKEGADKRKDIGLVADYDPHNTINS